MGRNEHFSGTALTHALFTLVGIAGEGDLDAPDLPAAGLSPEPQKHPQSAQQHLDGLDQPTTQIASSRTLQPSNRRSRPGKPPKFIACFRRPSAPVDF
jgi:hypothetical protein